ncbi:MAG: type IV pili twitching motility protein PilT, partial [Planctomycetes bacterium]|nr:type IV pili twitching motility protein PilT [Planctomycetota bacterium]
MHVDDYFRFMVENGASDLFLKAGSRPSMRVDGRVKFIENEESTPEFCREVFQRITGSSFEERMRAKEMDLA